MFPAANKQWQHAGQLYASRQRDFTASSYLAFVEQFFGANVRNTLLDDIGADLIYIQKLKMAEHHLYGSSRLGVRKDSLYLYDTRFQATSVDTITGSYDKDSIYYEDSAMVDTLWASRTLTHKRFELSNHLGNVLSTISDRKTFVNADTSGGETLVLWDADVLLAQDYYPFGMIMPDRQMANEEYRFGFNGKEQDPSWSGNGNIYDYGFRIYNPRSGKFLSVDPLFGLYPWYTPYHFAGNVPVVAIDLDGLEPVLPSSASNIKPKLIKKNEVTIFYPQSKYSHRLEKRTEERKTFLVEFGSNRVEFTKRNSNEIKLVASMALKGVLYDSYKIRRQVTPKYGEKYVTEELNIKPDDKNFEKSVEHATSKGPMKAFRHVAWQGLLAAKFGEDVAKEIGDETENANFRDDYSYGDLLNNEEGRKFGLAYEKENPNFWETEEGLEKYYDAVYEHVLENIESVPENQNE